MGVTRISDSLFLNAVMERFIDDTVFMLCNAVIQPWTAFYNKEASYIFEGAQGLLLDEERGEFPYVTRSRTGLHNVRRLLREADMHDRRTVEAYYVTRAYATRHGQGPLPNELDGDSDYFFDSSYTQGETNTPNPHQGHLRYAKLDVERVGKEIKEDIARASHDIDVVPHVYITCCDHVRWISSQRLAAQFMRLVGDERVYESYSAVRPI
jgi:adenylosuccinate synthase